MPTIFKKKLHLICLIVLAITLNSCKKTYYYWQAYCDTGHAHWEGVKNEWPKEEDKGDTMRSGASADASDHDRKNHPSTTVRVAQIRYGSYRKKY